MADSLLSGDNPLLKQSGLPSFDKIKPEHFLPALRQALAMHTAEIAAIKKNPGMPTFKNTVEALEYSGQLLRNIDAVFGIFSSALGNEEMEKISGIYEQELARHESSITTDQELFSRIKAVFGSPPQQLSVEEKFLLEKTYKKFMRNGALLSTTDKETFKILTTEIKNLEIAFYQNVQKSSEQWQKIVENENDLDGVSVAAKQLFRGDAEKAGMPGKWLIKLTNDPWEVTYNCKNRDLRREVHTGLESIGCDGVYDNRKIILDIIKKRHQKAVLLGYENHASYILDDRMGKTPQTIFDFLERSKAVYKKAHQEDLDAAANLAEEMDGLTKLEAWDEAYYLEKIRRADKSFDSSVIHPYLEFSQVIKGLDIHLGKLFGIQLKAADGAYSSPHPDVKTFEVIDKESRKKIGLFCIDPFARTGKSQNAWSATAYSSRSAEKDGFSINYAFLNIPKPSDGKPVLLSLSALATLLHETGHAFQHILSKGKYPSLQKIAPDFNEVFSQLLENWHRKPAFIKSFAFHHETGEPLPEEILAKLENNKRKRPGWLGMYHVTHGLLDMIWHTTSPDDIHSVEELEDRALQDVLFFSRGDTLQSTGFNHIFNFGYDAGYYGYHWANMMVADLFQEFEKNGLYDPKTAKRMKDLLYAMSGTADPADIFRTVAGRDPNLDTLFRIDGLLPEPSARQKTAHRKKSQALGK